MKYSVPLLLGAICAFTAFADSDYDVNRVDARSSRFDYRQNQVIVKFKDSSATQIRAVKSSKFKTSNVKAVDDLFASIGVEEVEELMPLTGNKKHPRLAKSFNGKTVSAPDMQKVYLLKLKDNSGKKELSTIHEAVTKLKNLADVEFAEPNYIMHALADESTPNDSYYSTQWGLKEINVSPLWSQPTVGDKKPIIAILDTGVDILHPDLEANIWTNEKENSGVKGYDDDGNGFSDDLHGWDFVNQTGLIADYNGHGTHCAGIAAATGNNGIGIVGANPDARIMPVTVMQSNGQGDVATIIKGIDYATANGADVISMSLGSYAESLALEQALSRAYQSCILVAAAGNDGYCLNHRHPERGQMVPMPMFPAAYTFVIGVQASSQSGLAGFSNYDDNGAIFSEYSEEKLYNYEITAPGAAIMSTYPNGQYKELNGTSMATPLVAGAISRLIMSKEVTNKEELLGDLINSKTANGNLDIYAAWGKSDLDRVPELQVIGFEMADADGDGRADAGETVEIYPVLRNSWGTASNIKLELSVAELANNFCEILAPNAEFGNTLSSYGKAQSANPLKIKFNDDVVDGRICRFFIRATCDNAETVEQAFELSVENGVEIGGILKEDMTLHAGVHYIVTKQFAVPEGRTLTIEPGTVIKFKDGTGFNVIGTIIANGEPGKMIVFTKSDLDLGNISLISISDKNKISYCIFENLTFNSQGVEVHNATDCIYRNCSASFVMQSTRMDRSNYFYLIGDVGLNAGTLNESNIISNKSGSRNWTPEYFIEGRFINGCNVFSNYLARNRTVSELVSIACISKVPSVFTPSIPNYLGSSNENTVRSQVVDINYPNSESFVEYDLSNMLTRPVAEAHGIVWKVVVDGYDAQDEFDMLPPLGVGKHKFEVYFNRPMNKEKTPMIAMGVRPPHTQNAIAEEGAWNEAGDVYTAYMTISGKLAIDGLNRIYVAQAEDDEFFEIPVENTRFNVNVQAAGSMSEGFTAEAGLGRVSLQWDNSEENFDDMLGVNLYRYTIGENEMPTDTICLNRQLLEPQETTYTDYDVTPGTTYCYYYKVMRTSLTELDPSKTVAATPLTSVKGDANASGDADVADVLCTVNYASGMNPKPFIFDAADVNADKEIDILDVVGIVNIILQVPDAAGTQTVNEAVLSVEDGVLWIDSSVELAGIQIDLASESGNSVKALESLNGFETSGSWLGDTYRFLAYNLNGKTIPAGKHAILNINGGTVSDARLSDRMGNNVNVTYGGVSGIDLVDKDAEVLKGAKAGVYNTMGVKVGETSADLENLAPSIYIVNGWKVVKK